MTVDLYKASEGDRVVFENGVIDTITSIECTGREQLPFNICFKNSQPSCWDIDGCYWSSKTSCIHNIIHIVNDSILNVPTSEGHIDWESFANQLEADGSLNDIDAFVAAGLKRNAKADQEARDKIFAHAAVLDEQLKPESFMDSFTDISHEKVRSYYFMVNHQEIVVEIHEPAWLKVSDNGHRIVDTSGGCSYIPNNWVFFRFENKDPSIGFTF